MKWHQVVTEDPAEAEVTHWGRMLYWVASRSRNGKAHLVDLEGFHDRDGQKETHLRTFCTCEAFRYHHHRPCWHLIAALWFAIDIIPVDTRTKRAAVREFQRSNNVPVALALLSKPERKKRIYNLPANR